MLSSLLLLLNSSLPLPATPPSCPSDDISCVVIEENQSHELSEFGDLSFVGIVEDSRCPVDVLCIWEGQVKVELKHTFPGGAQKFVVGIGGDLEPTYTDAESGRILQLEQVWPEPSLANPIDAPYQIKLRVAESADESSAP